MIAAPTHHVTAPATLLVPSSPPAPARQKSILRDITETQLAIELIDLGARLQVLESEVSLPRVRLVKLYKELRGVSPPKGMLPFSADWFVTWRPNAHASLLLSAYRFAVDEGGLSGIRAILSAYRLYKENAGSDPHEEVLSFTRAWTLVRFAEGGLLQLSTCTCCKGRYVTHAYDPRGSYVCGLCAPPARAGKSRKACRERQGEAVTC